MKNRKSSSNWPQRKMLSQCFSGASKETGELLGEAEKGAKERLQMPRGWGESSLGITVLWASLEQTGITFFE